VVGCLRVSVRAAVYADGGADGGADGVAGTREASSGEARPSLDSEVATWPSESPQADQRPSGQSGASTAESGAAIQGEAPNSPPPIRDLANVAEAPPPFGSPSEEGNSARARFIRNSEPPEAAARGGERTGDGEERKEEDRLSPVPEGGPKLDPGLSPRSDRPSLERGELAVGKGSPSEQPEPHTEQAGSSSPLKAKQNCVCCVS